MITMTETFYLGILHRFGQRDAEGTTLGTIESTCCNGHTSHHIVLGNPFHQFGITIDDIRMRLAKIVRPIHVTHKGQFEAQIAYFVPSGIEVQLSVEPDGLFRTKEGADRSVGL